jgi:HEAT repeat protein
MRRRRLKWFLLALAAALIALAATGVTHSRRSLRNSEIDALCKSLVDTDAATSEAAAAKLAAIQDPAGIRRLAVNAGSSDPRIPGRVESILASMGSRAVAPVCLVWRRAVRPADPRPYMWDNPRLQPWYAAWLGLPKGTNVRAWARPADQRLRDALVKIGRGATPEMLRMMAGGDPGIKLRAIGVLVYMRDPRNASLFVRMLDDPDPKVPWDAARGLHLLEMTRNSGPSRPFDSDREAWQAYDAARAEIVSALVKALNREDLASRGAVALALGAHKDSPAATGAVLKVIYDTSESSDVRTGALASLARSAEPRDIKALADMTRDGDPKVRCEAVRFLPQDDSTAASVALLLDSTDSALQQGAQEYFRETERPETIRLIADAFEALSPAGRSAAVDVLTAIVENTRLDGSRNAPPTHPDAVKFRAALHQAAVDALARIQSASPPSSPSLDSSAPVE